MAASSVSSSSSSAGRSITGGRTNNSFPFALTATVLGLGALGYASFRRGGFLRRSTSSVAAAPLAASQPLVFGTGNTHQIASHARLGDSKIASYGGGGEALFKAGGNYGAHRPSYPDRLYQRIESYAVTSRVKPRAELAIDVACGTGQATLDLRRYYDNVIGVEASDGQRNSAVRGDSVVYLPGRAEALPLGDGVADLVTVAQAAHWFDLPVFFSEANRVLKPGGSAAVWCYGLVYLDNVCAQGHLYALYEGTLGKFWDERRKLIDQLYETVAFPSPPWVRLERETKRLNLWEGKQLTLTQFINYLSTWSAYNTYRAKQPESADPLVQLKKELLTAYGGTNADDVIVHCEFDVTLLLAQKATPAITAAAATPATTA